MKYARISPDNFVVEVFTPLEGFTLEESFVPEIAEQFTECPDYVLAGWIKNEDGSFSEPPPPPEPPLPADPEPEV